MTEFNFTINYPPITKKNSQRIITLHGHPAIIASKCYKQYEKYCVDNDVFPPLELNTPLNIKAVYYMPTRRKVDLTNLNEALHDIMVRCGVITDDNCKIIVSTDGSKVSYDKENPRTEITITKLVDYINPFD